MDDGIECDLAAMETLGENQVARKALGDPAHESRSVQQLNGTPKPLDVC
jgi:hypothetical protein